MTKDLLLGTNLGVLHVLWMLVSGALLPEGGALFGGLQRIGLTQDAIRRAWQAFRAGQWIEQQENWVVQRYEGYRAVAVDITAFFRPTLKACPSTPIR